MSKQPSKEEITQSLDKVVDYLIDASVELHRIDITFNGVRNCEISGKKVEPNSFKATVAEIDSIATSLFLSDAE